MKHFLFSFFLFGFASIAWPQHFTVYKPSPACLDSILARKGKWKHTEDDVLFPDKTFPPNQYPLVNARIDAIGELIKSTVQQLNGIQPTWQRGIRGNAYLANGPLPYSFQSLYFPYHCNESTHKTMLVDETFSWIYFFVNGLNWFLEHVDTLDIHGDGKQRTIFLLPPIIGKWKGYTLYEPRIGSRTSRIIRSIVIGRAGKVPWRTLTRQEYLTGFKLKWEKSLLTVRANTSSEKDYQTRLAFINQYLQTAPADSLQVPVVIHPKYGIFGFKGKFGNEDSGGRRLIIFTPASKYFDTTLPRHVPQLIQVYWSYQRTPAELLLIKQFEENFPLELLVSMIDNLNVPPKTQAGKNNRVFNSLQ